MANLATFGQRLVAIIVDHIILLIITIALAVPFGLQSALFSMAGISNPALYIAAWSMFAILSFVIWILYFTYFEAKDGQTLGKRMMGIKVVMEKGTKMTYEKSFVRNILRIIDWLPAVYILGFIVAVASKNNQRIGDLAARTLVVKA